MTYMSWKTINKINMFGKVELMIIHSIKENVLFWIGVIGWGWGWNVGTRGWMWHGLEYEDLGVLL